MRILLQQATYSTLQYFSWQDGANLKGLVVTLENSAVTHPLLQLRLTYSLTWVPNLL